MTVRVAVIGTGFGARVVAPVFAATEGCEVVAVLSPRDDVARDLRAHRPDLVSVHSPPFLHAAHVGAALDVGAAVLCDKPCTPSAAATSQLLAAADHSGRVHLVNFEFRWEPARQAIKELLATGSLGEIEHVSWHHVSAGSREPLRDYGWLFDSALGGGWIGAWASHAVDALRWWFGELDVEWSRPRTDIEFRRDREGIERRCTAEDGVTAALRTASGASIVIDSTFAATASRPARITILGSRGVVECVDDRVLHVRGADGVRDDIRFDAEGCDRHRLPLERWANVVRDSVIAGVAVDGAPTLRDGLAVDRVLDSLRGA